MPGNKTKEQNDEGWRKWYSLPENKNKYLHKKLLNRINKGEIVKLTTLRKYGLLQHYKKETTRANKRKLKEELSIEPLYYARLVEVKMRRKKKDPPKAESSVLL